MTNSAIGPTICETVGVFDDAETLQAAIIELHDSAFDRSEISLLSSERTVENKLGGLYARALERRAVPDVSQIIFAPGEPADEGNNALVGP